MPEIINSQETEWHHAEFNVMGLTIRGMRGFKVKLSQDSEHLHAAGKEAVGIQSGNVKVDGSYKFLKSEIDKMNDTAQAAGYDSIIHVPYQLITSTIAFKKGFNRQLRTLNIVGIKFTEFEEAMEQGAKMMEVEVPFLAMRAYYK